MKKGLLLLGSVAVSAAVYAIVAWSLFDLSSNRPGEFAGEFIGTSLAIFLIGFFINKRKITITLISICLLVETGIFVVRYVRMVFHRFSNENAVTSVEARKAFVEGMIRLSQQKQLSNPVNAGMSKQEMTEYCACEASGIASIITNSAMREFPNGGKFPSWMQSKIDAVATNCSQAAKARLGR